MRISVKKRRFMVSAIMLAFIMTSLLMPAVASADSTGSTTFDIAITGNLAGGQINNPAAAGQGFNDIQNHPCEAAIRALQAIGLVNGYPDGSFRPDAPATQMETIVLVMRLAGHGDEKIWSTVNDEEFTNVPDWGKPAAQRAVQSGIISIDNFQASAPATRVQIMVWLAKTIGLEKEDAGSLPFKDSQLILPADTAYIQALFDKDLIKGNSQGNFEPNGVMTRAQLAVILQDILNKNLVRSLDNNDKELVSLDILTVNDFHGALLADTKNPGAAILSQWLKDAEGTNPEGTLILSAGDMSQGSIDSNLLFGKTVIKVMNATGFDAMAVGNHEFDWGLESLQNQAAWADFPVLTANITDKQTGQSLAGTQPWIMLERKGVKIGIIGITTGEMTNLVSPKVVSTCKIEPPADTITRLVPQLKERGAQVIIVLAHLGGYIDNETHDLAGEITELANSMTGVDVLVTGHTHQKMTGYMNGTAVVQAYYNGRAVGHISLIYSPQLQTTVAAIPAVIDLPTPGLAEDTRVKAIIDQGEKELGPVKNEIIGENLTELSHQRDELSLLGQWVTDIMRQEAKADIAFQNGGGLRTGIPAGTITVGKLWEVLPFDNTLILLDMKGSQVKEILQYGINNPQYGSLQYSGIKVKYDPALPADKRILEVTLPDGSILDPEKNYRVVTNDFMAGGGDEYTMFKAGSNVTDTHLLVRDILINNIRNIKIIDFKGDDRLLYNRSEYRQESAAQAYQRELARAA